MNQPINGIEELYKYVLQQMAAESSLEIGIPLFPLSQEVEATRQAPTSVLGS